MVDITPHPKMCEVCRSSRAVYCFRRVMRVSRETREQWLCVECYQASVDRSRGTDDARKT